MAATTRRGNASARPLGTIGLPKGFITAGLLLGVGLGGFVDGIVLHQMLQWHHMLTDTGHHPANTVSGLKDNTLWDGVFHGMAWVATALGLYVLWESAPIHRRGWGVALLGIMLFGFGLFNMTEGLIDHQILGIHHVRDDVSNKLPWDMGFLGISAALMTVGYFVTRRGAAMADRPPSQAP